MFGRALSGISSLVTGKTNDDEWKALVEACAEGKDKYVWDGLTEVRISQYEHAKEKAYDGQKDTYEADDPEWPTKLDERTSNELKDLLLKRAIGLVHVLKPIEDERTSVANLAEEGKLKDGYKESFEAADEECQTELAAVLEEAALLMPGKKPKAIIQQALQMYAAGQDPLAASDVMTRGYANRAGRKAHGLPIGAKVETLGLKNEKLNGIQGRVLYEDGDLVACSFGRQYGERFFKAENLKLIEDHEEDWESFAEIPIVNPEATEMPTVTIEIVYKVPHDINLGLGLAHEPPLDKQSDENPGYLRIVDIEENFGAYAHGMMCMSTKIPECRLDLGDKILAVCDCSKPLAERDEPVHGNSQKIAEYIEQAKRPLVFIVERELGPPLRFKIGEVVLANCEDMGMQEGTIEAVWTDYQEGKAPYVIRLSSTGAGLMAPIDNDSAVQRAPPRFEVGADVMVNYDGEFRKAAILECECDRLHTSYKVLISKANLGEDAEEDMKVNVPFDSSELIRPKARFDIGTEVVVLVGSKWLTGLVKDLYNPRWVYLVECDDLKDPVPVSLDIDVMIRER